MDKEKNKLFNYFQITNFYFKDQEVMLNISIKKYKLNLWIIYTKFDTNCTLVVSLQLQGILYKANIKIKTNKHL